MYLTLIKFPFIFQYEPISKLRYATCQAKQSQNSRGDHFILGGMQPHLLPSEQLCSLHSMGSQYIELRLSEAA